MISPDAEIQGHNRSRVYPLKEEATEESMRLWEDPQQHKG